jgi:hypothetical protein
MNKKAMQAVFTLAGIGIGLSTLAFASPDPAPAAASGVKTFDTPKQAADALVQAAASGDQAAVLALFGPDGKDIVTSGDPVEDKNRMAKFAELAKQKMEIKNDGAAKAIVDIGPDDWPLPVPLVQSGGKWHYDAKQGREEILNRRIGGNELETINLLRGYVEAQEEYASVPREEGAPRQYAQKFISSPGKHDGLSWMDSNGKPAGPMGDQIAKALAEGYTDKTQPYNGYYFRPLTSQGPSARLGARDYIWKGAMVGGFAVVAWPANYGVSGIQTFQVNNDGVVYQKDLGPQTAEIAKTITTYNPDKTWVETKDEE